MKYLLIPFSILALSACSSDESETPIELEKPAVATYGVFTSGNDDLMLVDENGNIQVSAAGNLYSGNVTLLSESFGGTVTYFNDGDVTGQVSISSEFTGNNVNSIADVTIDGKEYSFTRYNSNNDVGLDVIAKSYATTDFETTITISNNGTLTGNDGNCLFNGSVEHPNSDLNLYSVNMQISSCGDYDGEYTGLTILGKPNSEAFDKGLIMQFNNPGYAFNIYLDY